MTEQRNTYIRKKLEEKNRGFNERKKLLTKASLRVVFRKENQNRLQLQ